LAKYAPTAEISTMPSPMAVRGLGDKLHNANQFTVLDFYLPAENNVIAHVCREIHIVDNLQANALLGLDISVPEGWIIDLDSQQMVLPYCAGVKLPIITCVRDFITRLPVYATYSVKLKPNSRQMVRVRFYVRAA
jgi:hypothetical protein